MKAKIPDSFQIFWHVIAGEPGWILKELKVRMHVVQVNSRPILPGAAMFEAAQAAGASLAAHSTLPNAALQHAAIPAPLMLQKSQVTHRTVSSHASMPVTICSLPLEWRLKQSLSDAKPMGDQNNPI